MTNERAVTASGAGLPARLTLPSNALAKVRETRDWADDEVPHISEADVRRMVDAARAHRVNGERDALLVSCLFDGALRCKEALAIRPFDIKQDESGYYLQDVHGKRYKGQDRIRRVAVSGSLVNKLLAYAYQRELDQRERFFPVTGSRVRQIVATLMRQCGIQKPAHVGSVHVLRHSGAIERLRATGNPKAVQDLLGHRNAQMTLRYMKTLSKEETLKIQQKVDFKW